ncbi:hypothetical protein CKALI_10900 [Corynebacterium kalinowskii]|uniref:Uncharacterized protein n=1 Tax=Corynebacterium kalinowskii TaxID=2675216 RepID=A0A6B8VJ17_9CORY|nr:hypothetical protein [Corynebacterium kalinowskii]QGU03029.1 hypothetical protein CKALI_10900 [Corynebacterium kalinowskii]
MASFDDQAIEKFFDQIEATLSSALPFNDEDVHFSVDLNADNGIYVAEFEVPLYHGYGTVGSFRELTKPPSDLFQVFIRYQMGSDRNRQHLTVQYSKFELRVHTSPGVRFEYEREKNNVPAAHIHFSGMGGLLTPALMKNFSGRNKGKGKAKKGGQIQSVHFPVGGHRFRPSLEDFLYFVIEECGFTGLHGWEKKLQDSRNVWFDHQLSASVRDHPEHAAEALRKLGYKVESPATPPSVNRHDGW